MIRKIFSIGLVLLISSIFAQPIQVTQESASSMVIEFNLPDFEIVDQHESSKIYQQIICDNAISTSKTGYPVLPYFNGIIGIPTNGDIDFQIIEKKQRTRTGIKLQPATGILQQNTKNQVRDVNYNFKLYPENLLGKGNKAFIGDRKMRGLNIFPFQYIPKRNELLITTKIQIRVNIIGDLTQNRNYLNSNNYIDKLGDSFFLNNKFSKKWRREKQPVSSYPPRSSDLVSEIQIVVDEEGIYKVSYELLTETLSDPEYPIMFEMEFDWDQIDPRNLELHDLNGAIPIHFVGEADGSFDPGDYFEFFGDRNFGEESYYDDYTSENVYTLKLTNHTGSRMAVENGGLGNINANQFIIPESFKQTVHLEEQNTSNKLGAQFDFNTTDFYREDIWFWEKINAPTLEVFPFDLQYPHQSTIRHFDAKVCLYGSTYNDDSQYAYEIINHYAQVNINSSLIDQHEWFGQNEQMFDSDSQSLPIPNQILSHGQNNLYVSVPGLPNIENEQVLLDYFELSYWREYKTDTNKLRFTKPHNKPLELYQFEIQNFSNDSIYVYKIGSSFLENLQIKSFYQAGGSPYTVSFQDSIVSENTEYYAVTNDQKKVPKFIRPNIPSNLRVPANLAEYLIITKQEFTDNENLLIYKQLWESQGINTKIVAIQDIFDEFNNGIRSIESMKEFLSFAYNNWSTPTVSHVLLLGDGLSDERDDSSNRGYNLIPFKNIWAQRRGAIPSDNWLGCIVGDDLVPDVSIGRISIWEEEQIEDVVNKSIHYMNEPNYEDRWHSRVILAAGGNPGEGTFFAKQSERIKNRWIPDDYYTKRVYCNTDDLPDGYNGNTTSLISGINDGAIFVQFMGHGGGYVWADYNLLNEADVSTFNNENYPLVASLSCYGSAFNLPQSSSIGEELILIPEKGAIAHVGFTGYGYANADEVFGKKLNEGIFDKQIGSIGKTIDFTKAKFYAAGQGVTVNVALIEGCALLGDPMIRMIPAEEKREVTLDAYNLSEGDTLHMSSFVGDEIEEGKFIVFDEDDIQLPINQYYPFDLPNINDTISTSDFIIPNSVNSIYKRYVKFYGYGNNMEVTGMTNFTVGQSAVVNLVTLPENPTSNDSVYIQADFFDQDGINYVDCINETSHDTINMVNINNSRYETENAIQPYSPGSHIYFHFNIVDALGDTTETETTSYVVSGPDLIIEHIELSEFEDQPALKLLVRNSGTTISEACDLIVYDHSDTTFINSINVAPLEELETSWIYCELPMLHNTLQFKAIVNEDQISFDEISYYNNSIISDIYTINMFEIDSSATEISSLDSNLECIIPEDLFSETSICYINNIGSKEPLNQPDIQNILLADGTYSTAYHIDTLNPDVLADSLGHFQDNKTVTLQFHYHPTDSLTQVNEQEDNFSVYRWEEDYQKWILMGKEINQEDNIVSYETNRIGIYTIIQNLDTTPPFIEANVEGQEFTQSTSSNQEFTHGGYISKNGIISFMLLDSNGINVFDNSLSLFLSDGTVTNEINSNQYALSLTQGNLTNVPLKYALDGLTKGTYQIVLDCQDVNGNQKSLDIEFDVNDEFDVINFANYPNPVKTVTVNKDNAGRTRFTYVLTDDADKVSIKVYTVSGRLVKTFKNLPAAVGYHEYPRVLGWDCRDDKGYYLANGVYFYRITAKKNNKKVEKTQKMAILK